MAASDFIFSFAFCSSKSIFAFACSSIFAFNLSPSAMIVSFSFSPAFFADSIICPISLSVFLSRSLTSLSVFCASSFASVASLRDFSISSVRFLKYSAKGLRAKKTRMEKRNAKFMTGQNQSFHVKATCSPPSSAAKTPVKGSKQ
jgi:hypothetical protein